MPVRGSSILSAIYFMPRAQSSYSCYTEYSNSGVFSSDFSGLCSGYSGCDRNGHPSVSGKRYAPPPNLIRGLILCAHNPLKLN